MRFSGVAAIILLFTLVACKASHKLDRPIRNGDFVRRHVKSDSMARRTFYLIPKGDYKVRAAEEAVVKVVGNAGDEYFVMMQGQYTIWYMHLSKLYVKKGDTVERGKVFGEVLNYEGAPEAGELMVQVQRGGKYIYNTGIFGR